MLKLLDGIAAFHAGLTQTAQQQFAALALQQSPDAAFIGCSDSRVDPRIFASNEPGDVFVTRNVGNLVPANGAPVATPESASTLAVIEYALLQLKVSHIIVCGHSECGGMMALAKGTRFPEAPHLEAGALRLYGWWFEIATASVHAYDEDQKKFAVIDRTHADKIRKAAMAVRKVS